MQDKREIKYLDTAKLYDYDVRNISKDDIPFYLEYADKIKDDILELGCGTGRLTIPIAENNFNIWGIDIAEPMLEVLRNKIDSMPEEFKKNIHVSQNNMASFNLDKQFGMIFIPFRTFQSITSSEEQKNCLKMVLNHLKDDGIFIINVFKPFDKMDKTWINKEEIKNWETFDEIKKLKIVRTDIRNDIDLSNQIIYPILNYYLTDENGKIEKFVEELSLKYYFENQMIDLLNENGFEIVEEYGYYDKSSIKNGSEMIFICRKTVTNLNHK